MNNKSKFSMGKIGNFFREVAVVVIGVAITISVTIWITNKNEKRDMNLYLNAIKTELEGNVKILEEAVEFYQFSEKYYQYLESHDKDSLHLDTLNFYAEKCCYSLRSFPFKINAYEMFKTTGMMRLMNDKELMLSISDVYLNFSILKDVFDWHFNTKWETINKEIPVIFDKNFPEDGYLKAPPLYYFYVSGIEITVLNNCQSKLSFTKEVLEKLEKELNK
jgi:hypothetical protein